MKVAVTGGSGQLGTVVVRALLAQPGIDAITSIDLRPPALVDARLRHVTADVRDPAIVDLFAGCDAVLHLAFVVTRKLAPELFFGINVGGTKNVAEAAARAAVDRIVCASSITAYGVLPGHATPLVEEAPRRDQPAFPYASAKWQVEAWLDEFERAHPAIAVARVRPSILVGTRIEHGHGKAYKARMLPDGGATPFPWVWDEDVADLIVLALTQRARGAFNASADDDGTSEQIARAVGMKLVRVPKGLMRGIARVSPLLERLGVGESVDPGWFLEEDADVRVDCGKARRELGWSPRCPTATSVLRRFLDRVPEREPEPLARLLRVTRGEGVRHAAAVGARRLLVTVEGAGDYTLSADEGAFRFAAGVPRPPTAVVTIDAADLFGALAGGFATGEHLARARVDTAADPRDARALFAAFLDAVRPHLGANIARWRASQPPQPTAGA